jgi:hypothetical protein
MELKIVNANPAYVPVKLVEPATRGYIHVGAEVRPRRLLLLRSLQRLPAGREKAALIGRLTELARQLEHLEAVEKVTIFDALAIAPARSAYLKERGDSIHVPRFDLVVLIETTSPAVIRDLQSTPLYEALLDALRSQAKRLHVMAGRNAKRVDDVDKTRQGLFLFNYFVADDARVMLQLWDYLAGWFAVETGLDNSTLLVPLEGERSDYLAINNARSEEGLARLLWRLFSKKSFRTYVLANLEANRVGAMPIFYRLAGSSQQAASPQRPWVLAAGMVAFGAGLALARRRRAYARVSSFHRRR